MKTENKRKISAGIVQFDVQLSDIEANLETAFEKLRILGSQGVQLAVLPELWTCGFDDDTLVSHAEKTPYIVDKLSKEAAGLNMIIAGSMPELIEDDLFNTMYVIDKDGSISGCYRKIHLFSLTGENKYFSAGKRAVVCKTSAGFLGLMICYDLRFPELCRALALKGAQIVIVSAQWPKSRIEHWNILLSARAVENQLYIVAANRCGRDAKDEYGGCSRVVSPLGTILLNAKEDECAISALIDFKKIAEFRNKIPCLNERLPDAYIA